MKFLKLSLLPILIALILALSVARKRKKAQLKNATSELFKTPTVTISHSDATDCNYETAPRQTGKNEMESINPDKDHCAATKKENYHETIKVVLEAATLIVLIITLCEVSQYTHEAFLQRVAMESAVSLTRDANNLTRKLLSTEAAEILIEYFGPDPILWDKRQMPTRFINRAKLKATDFQGRIEFTCKSLADNKILGRRSFPVGGNGAPMGQIVRDFPLPPGCTDQQDFLHTRVGLIRQWNVTYLNGLDEKAAKSSCEEYLVLHYPNRGAEEGWKPCENVSTLLETAIVPYEGN
jgi:hypothetical protein